MFSIAGTVRSVHLPFPFPFQMSANTGNLVEAHEGACFPAVNTCGARRRRSVFPPITEASFARPSQPETWTTCRLGRSWDRQKRGMKAGRTNEVEDASVLGARRSVTLPHRLHPTLGKPAISANIPDTGNTSPGPDFIVLERWYARGTVPFTILPQRRTGVLSHIS
jgi:hypothetical protein